MAGIVPGKDKLLQLWVGGKGKSIVAGGGISIYARSLHKCESCCFIALQGWIDIPFPIIFLYFKFDMYLQIPKSQDDFHSMYKLYLYLHIFTPTYIFFVSSLSSRRSQNSCIFSTANRIFKTKNPCHGKTNHDQNNFD